MVETETEKTPLQQKLDEFGNQLSKVWSAAALLPVHGLLATAASVHSFRALSPPTFRMILSYIWMILTCYPLGDPFLCGQSFVLDPVGWFLSPFWLSIPFQTCDVPTFLEWFCVTKLWKCMKPIQNTLLIFLVMPVFQEWPPPPPLDLHQAPCDCGVSCTHTQHVNMPSPVCYIILSLTFYLLNSAKINTVIPSLFQMFHLTND